MYQLWKRTTIVLTLLSALSLAVLLAAPSAEAAGVKIIYQTPPEGITLNADKASVNLANLAVGGYTNVRVVAHVRASSVGTNKVEVRLDHEDAYLSPYAASPKLSFPLWSKTLGNDGYVSTLIDRPGAVVKLNANVNASSGDFYTVDIFVYGFK
jgi:hypothetical protein